MKKFIVRLQNKKKNTLTNMLLEQHVAHLKDLYAKKNLYLCGPLKDNDGAIQILIADSMAEAKEFVLADPFVKHSYYQDYQIDELIEANESNNWLMEDGQTKDNLQTNK